MEGQLEMNKKCLITGGAGFLGINLVRYLLKKGWSVASLDKADFIFDDVIGEIEILHGDIRDREFVDRSMEGMQIVVHCAAA